MSLLIYSELIMSPVEKVGVDIYTSNPMVSVTSFVPFPRTFQYRVCEDEVGEE